MDFPKSLVEALRAHRVIPFVGAGISMAARLRGSEGPAFPCWVGLLRQAAQVLRDEQKAAEADYVESCLALEKPKVLEAAQTAQKALQADWSNFLVQVFRLQFKELSSESLEAARLLWRLGSNLIITTNFDKILGWTCAEETPITWRIENPHGHAQFMRGEHHYPTVWHLHGHIDEPDRLILTPDGYTLLYGNEVDESRYQAALATFRGILSSHTFLFVGFSLHDNSVNAQLNWLENTFRGQGGKHFALMRHGEIPLFKERGALGNVEAIPYEEHGEPLLRVLQEMARIVDPNFGEDDQGPQPQEPRSPKPSFPANEWPADLGIEMPDSFLLAPKNCIVPFHEFRRPLLERVMAWALAEEPRVALRLQVGPGGSGKSRLMFESARRLQAEHGWEAALLSSATDAVHELEPVLGSGKNCFVVVDYAETRPADVVALARAAVSKGCTGKVRLPLLARNPGAWWERLSDDTDGVLKAVLESPSSKTGPYRIDEEQVPMDARPAVFDEALRAFAAKKGTSVPNHARPDLTKDPFGEVLFIHLAALATLRGHPAEDDTELIDHALGHERAYWRHMLGECGLEASRLDDLAQVISHITLIGGTRSASESREAIAKTPRLRDQPRDLVQPIFDLLRRMYPNQGGVSGLVPDLIGERLVALALEQDDELLDLGLGPAASSEIARRTLTVLTRLAQRFRGEHRWLELALRRHLSARRREARQVATEVGGPMPAILMEVLTSAVKFQSRSGFRMVLDELWENVPRNSLYLEEFAIEIAEQRVEFVAGKGSGGAKQARRRLVVHRTLGEMLSKSGRLSEAAEHYRVAFELAKPLARGKEPASLRRLAGAADDLAVALAKVGQFEQALERGNQAEGLFQELAARQPDDYRADWATSLGNLANHLADLGRFEGALETAQQTEEIWRELAARQPDAYRAAWAHSLGNLASHLRDLGRFEDALERAQQGEEIRRELAAHHPDAYRDAWANSLGNVASHLRDLGRFEDALERAQQTEEIWRELAARQPDAYRADWAYSLGNLASHLGHLGRFEDALETVQQAEEIRRELAARQPDAYRADWAQSLGNLANRLRDLGRFEDALERAQQAEEIMRELAAHQPDAYRAAWANSLGNLASHLRDLGRFEDALERAQQTEEIWRELAARQPNAYRDDWANSLGNLANSLRDVGRFEDALERAQRAEEIWRGLAARQPDAYRADWAHSLGNLAESLVANDQFGASVEPATQGSQILEELHSLRPRAHRDHLAWCRRVLADGLIGVSEHARALPEAELACDLLSQVAAEQSGLHLEHFAKAAMALARAEEATGGDAAQSLVRGLDQIAPWFEGRERVLRNPVADMVRMLRYLAPDRLSAVPARMQQAAEDPDS